MGPISGIAAGVPYTALPPRGAPDEPAPLIVTWHMLDAPRTDAAFAAALPLTGVPAWRVHLGMPMCGARMVDGGLEAHVALAREDALMSYLAPVARRAAAEFPAALAAVREQLPVDDGPISQIGGSLGALVALQALSDGGVPVAGTALVNPAVRVATAVGLISGLLGTAYQWTDDARRVADELDFVVRAGDVAGPALLVVSGEQDHPDVRRDAADLVGAVPGAEYVGVPGLAHALADEPGLDPAPQTPGAAAVDAILTAWFADRTAAP